MSTLCKGQCSFLLSTFIVGWLDTLFGLLLAISVHSNITKVVRDVYSCVCGLFMFHCGLRNKQINVRLVNTYTLYSYILAILQIIFL